MAVVQRGGRVGGPEGGDDGEEGHEDDHEASDEGRLCGRGEDQTGGLELITGCEEEADNQAGEQGAMANVAELSVVHDSQGNEGQRHSEKVEQKRGGILQGVLDKDEGGSPDKDHRQQQNVGEGSGAESFEQLVLRSGRGRLLC